MGRHPLFPLTVAASLLLSVAVVACSTPKAAVSLAAACQTADAALRVALVADREGRLTQGQIDRITRAGKIVNAVCSQPVPPTDVAGAITVVLTATADLGVR